jgi:hypothetical protein
VGIKRVAALPTIVVGIVYAGLGFFWFAHFSEYFRQRQQAGINSAKDASIGFQTDWFRLLAPSIYHEIKRLLAYGRTTIGYD